MVFLHGWGQSRQIWYQQMKTFSGARFLNLPGHGANAKESEEASGWLEAVATQLPDQPSIIVGWSLGGIMAMQLALQYPDRVAGLVLVSTTPAFCNREGWQHGCNRELFDAFESGVKNSSPKTMSRFFALMLHGDGISRAEYNRIARQAIDKSALPSSATLKAGLDYLATTDLRKTLPDIQQPTLVLHGAKDAIIPTEAGKALAETVPHARWHLFSRCGHAPFLTQSKTFDETVEAWCQEI
jgi:pimeloyl-[acyl-carrier protein] methyl ester esterase